MLILVLYYGVPNEGAYAYEFNAILILILKISEKALQQLQENFFKMYKHVICFGFNSGGIDRDWIGAPRMLFESTSEQGAPRCACVKLDSKEYEENKAMLKEYDGCAKHATKCILEMKKT